MPCRSQYKGQLHLKALTVSVRCTSEAENRGGDSIEPKHLKVSLIKRSSLCALARTLISTMDIFIHLA